MSVTVPSTIALSWTPSQLPDERATNAVTDDPTGLLSRARAPGTLPASVHVAPSSTDDSTFPSVQRTWAPAAEFLARSTTATLPQGATVRPPGARTLVASLASRERVPASGTVPGQLAPPSVVLRTPIPQLPSAPTANALFASLAWIRMTTG